MKSNYSIYMEAIDAGHAALNAATPTPMVVVEADIWGNPVAGATRHYVDEGACGFAWIQIKGNTGFGREMKKLNLFSKAYPTGLQYWVGEGGQSVERKEAFARAFAKVLNKYGIQAYAGSRLD
jgi:hypothetical protein